MADEAPNASRSSKRPAPGPRPSRGRRIARIAIAFLACVVVTEAIFGERGLIEKLRARRQHDALAGEIEQLKRENAGLREQARRLREDPRTIEEVARRELGLIREGELVFIVKDVPAPSARTP